MAETGASIRGSCLCRAMAYEVSGRLGPMWHCHCVICRKLSGTAFATHVEALASDFLWLHGQELITHYALSSAHARSFCRQRGSVVPYVTCDGTRVILPAGGLDDDPGVKPCAHGCVASQAPWHTITDDLPRFVTSPPNLVACPPAVVRPQPRPSGVGLGRGSCLCGGAVYEVRGTLDAIKNCHCWRDRKATGVPHDSCLLATASALRWLQGADLLVVYSSCHPECSEGFQTPEASLPSA